VQEQTEPTEFAGQRRGFSLPAKLTAAGFIALTLFGNFWLTRSLTRTPVPIWIGAGFALGLVVVGAGAVGLAVAAVQAKLGNRRQTRA